MRRAAFANSVSSFALGLFFCLGVAFTITSTGCGGNTSSGGTTTTVTSVTVSPATKTIMAGDSISFTATVAGQDNPSQAVTWSVSPATAGTITSGGVFTSSSTITATTTATITAASTVPGYTNITGSATVTIDLPVAQNPTASITASPSVITLGSTTALTWSSTNATSCTASGAWSGTQATSGSVTETPTATGTATYTLVCTGAGGSANASATVTVNAAPLPDITSVVPATIYADAEIIVGNIQVNGSGFAVGQTFITSGIVFGSGAIAQVVSPTQIALSLSFDTPHYSPGFITMNLCENSNGTNCGTPGTLAFLGARNYLASSSTGEWFFLDQAQGAPSGQNGYVRKYKADGTAESNCYIGALLHSIAVDDVTGFFIVDGVAYDASAQNGGAGSCDRSYTPYAQNLPSGTIMATAAKNGFTCFTQPSNNAAYCFDLTGGQGATPFVTASNLGNDPEPIAMGTFGTETDAFVLSVNDTPSPLLHKVRASDAYTGEEPALPLPGITPASAVQAANVTAGGWQVIVFDSGPASGTIAVLSTYDQLLVLVNESTWTVTQSVKLSGIPFRIVADDVNGRVLVAYANPVNATTAYAWVDAASGAVTPLTSTSPLLSVGLGFDGTNIVSSQRSQIGLVPNQ